MAIICSDTKLCDIVITEPSCITVLNRFNIFLGLGDKTVNDICAEKGLNLDFFIAILNTYLNEDYMLEDALMSSNINDIIEYGEIVPDKVPVKITSSLSSNSI